MKEAAKRFESGNLPDHIKPFVTIPLPASLVSVARSFVRLQDARHKADYDVAQRFDRAAAQDAVALATQPVSYTHLQVIRQSAAMRLHGGIIYDALLLGCARKVNAQRIYT